MTKAAFRQINVIVPERVADRIELLAKQKGEPPELFIANVLQEMAWFNGPSAPRDLFETDHASKE